MRIRRRVLGPWLAWERRWRDLVVLPWIPLAVGAAVIAPWLAAATVAAFCGITLIAGGASQVAMAAGTFTWLGF